MLGVDDYSLEDSDKSLYKPENITVCEAKKAVKTAEPVNVAPISMGNAEREDYLAEIASLRKKLHEKEQENKYLREVNRNARNAEKDAQELINKLQGDREELTAAIAEKNVAIIGGM